MLVEPFRDEPAVGSGATLRAEALTELAVIFTFLGQHQEAAPLLEEAMTTLEHHEAWPALAQGLLARGVSLIYDHRRQEAIAVTRQALALAEEHDLPSAALRAHYNLAGALLESDRFEDALREVEVGLTLARERGDRVWEAMLRAQSIPPLTILGRWDLALRPGDALLAGDDGSAVFAAQFLALIAAARGDGDLLARCAALGERQRDSTHIEMRSTAVAILARSVLDNAPGRALELARSVLDAPAVAAETIGDLFAVSAEAALDLGDEAAMADLAAWVEALPPVRAEAILRAGRARLRAELAHRSGQRAEAERLEREAVELLREAGARPMLVSAFLDQARRRGDPEALVQAREIALELGARHWLARIEATERVTA